MKNVRAIQNLAQAWEYTKGKGVTIAIIDTGINDAHEVFQGRTIDHYDFANEGIGDFHGHGSHVASIAAGDHTAYSGIAPEATIIDIKVLNRQGAGQLSGVIQGIEKAIQLGVDVINLSLGASYQCDGCFDTKTEILTSVGWKYFKDLNKFDHVYSVDPKTDIAEYYPIKKIIKYYYKGDIYSFKSSVLNFRVTPNHNLLIKTKNNINWRKEQAEKLPNTCSIKRTSTWDGYNFKTYRIKIMPSKHKYSYYYPEKVFEIKDWLELLGWFISAGSLGNCRVAISQKDSKLKQEIIDCIKRLGYSPKVKGNNIRFGNLQLVEHLRDICYIESPHQSYNKKVPNNIKILAKELIELFLESYCKGDGHIAQTKERHFYTSSSRLADDIQELIVKTGKVATIKVRDREGRKSWISNHIAITRRPSYTITEHRTFKDATCLKHNFTIEPYDDYVYCVEVEPHHTILVRRENEKGSKQIMWSGNSDPLSVAVDKAAQSGIVVCCAVGNDGGGRLITPTLAKLCISVGAIDTKKALAYFSSYGKTCDGRWKPDVLSLGHPVIAARLSGGFVAMSGTSMSTPVVAGTSALILSLNSKLNIAEVKEFIYQNTEKINVDDLQQGHGLVDIGKTVKAVNDSKPDNPDEPDDPDDEPEEPDRPSKPIKLNFWAQMALIVLVLGLIVAIPWLYNNTTLLDWLENLVNTWRK